jgi:hypothetical protein
MYIGHIINLGTYSKELNRKIFNQLTIVYHAHTICDGFDPLTFIIEANTPTIKPPHLLQYYITLHFIIKYFILNIIKT